MNDRITELRNIMKKNDIYGFLQPVQDEYLSEYPPEATRRLEWLTGFSGSAGTVAVTADKAAFFTDGRYTLQAKAEVDDTLFELHNSADTTPEEWISSQSVNGARIGYDARLYTASMLKRLETALLKKGAAAVAIDNPIDALWKNRPAAPCSPLVIHETRYCGKNSADKRRLIGDALDKAGADAALLVAPDSVNWLLNVRGNDTEHTPLALSVAIIGKGGHTQLFVEPSRCSGEVLKHLGNEVTVLSTAALRDTLAELGKHKRAVLCDPSATPVWHTQLLAKAGAKIVEGQDPCVLPKALKNDVELNGIRSAHLRDGVAVVKLLAWLDGETAKREVTEMEVGEALHRFRAEDDMFKSASFSTIAGSGENGAIVHYRSTPGTNRALKAGELLLLDSGGQYPDGTTDITRTVPVGAPNAEHKDRFTRVLKGHIAIATAVFPKGTAGSQLDVLARQYLWQVGLDYDHGTGHGVGCFLGVHEGPQRISKRGGDAHLAPGMIVSNEPGYYKSGEYGIRIENLVAVAEREKCAGGKSWYGFETLTCAPVDTRLVDAALLSPQEKQWLNDYHAWVERALSGKLSGEVRSWLGERCRPL